jgi:hypothetical protein
LEHSLSQHVCQVHPCLMVCDVDVGDPVQYGPPTLHSLLTDAHGVAHRHATSMYHWLKHSGVDWRGMNAQCQQYYCEMCERVNPAQHAMQPTSIPIGDRTDTQYSCDVMFYVIKDKHHPLLVLTDNLSDEVDARALDLVGSGKAPESLGVTKTGARKVFAALSEMCPPVGDHIRELYTDNECRLSDALVRELHVKLHFRVTLSVPNVHGNGVAERSNRRLRSCLDKHGVQSAAVLPAAIAACVSSLNESPTDRLRWHAPNDVPLMPPEAQRQLAEHIRVGKVRDRQRRRHRRRRTRPTLPTAPTPYLVRDHKLSHALYEGPFMGYACDLHGVNCRSIWRDGFHCTSLVHLKQCCGQVHPTTPP